MVYGVRSLGWVEASSLSSSHADHEDSCATGVSGMAEWSRRPVTTGSSGLLPFVGSWPYADECRGACRRERESAGVRPRARATRFPSKGGGRWSSRPPPSGSSSGSNSGSGSVTRRPLPERGLSGNDVRCRVSAVSSCVLSAVVCVMTREDQLGWSRYLPRVLKLPHSERTPMSARRQSPRPHGCQPITCANAAGARDAGHLAVYANSSMWWRELLGLLLEIVGSQGRLEVTGPTSFELVCESRCAIREAAASLR